MSSSPPAAATATAARRDDAVAQNTISHLPLLFANGYPTSLEKITEAQLEKFIPFMVGCSLGNVQSATWDGAATAPSTAAQTTPPWWPDDIPYVLPLVQPEAMPKVEWIRRLKELVCLCYEHHNNVFLLRFCTVLSKYEPECLRFINNYNSTTSLYDRFNNKLLVTFRNENMLYDREYTHRKCLLPRRRTGTGPESAAEDDAEEANSRPSMVEPPMFDIYLCDYCDAELYTLEACREHEKSCRETSEQGVDYETDVVICDGEEEDAAATAGNIASAVKRRNRRKPPAGHIKDIKAKKRKAAVESAEEDVDEEGDSNDAAAAADEADDAELRMRSFLSIFHLVSAKGTPAHNWPRSPRKSGGGGGGVGARSPVKSSALDKVKDKRRRTDRSVLTVQRCAHVPLTSPMGQQLLRTQKSALAPDYKQERNERLERFCVAPVVRDGVRPRWLTPHAAAAETFPVTYRAIDYRPMFEPDEGYDRTYVHQFRFPRRQLSTRWRDLSWLALSRVLLRSCRPCTVDLVRLTETDIRVYFLHLAIERKRRELMELRRADLKRMFEQQQRSLKRPPDECIDLCSSSSSSDEEGEGEGGKRSGPKRPCLATAAAVVVLDEDDTKENRAGDGGVAKQRPLRTHSAIQGDLARPLSLAVSGQSSSSSSWPFDGPHATQGSPQTAAQLGVLLPNDNANALVTSQQAMGQPSSYLFLTKQQVLVYQQSEVPSTVGAESIVVQEEEVVVTETAAATTTTTNAADCQIPTAADCVFGSILAQPVSSSNSTQETMNSPTVTTSVRQSLPAVVTTSSSSSSSASTAASRLRKSSVCDAFPLPKKLPSLIRIAPA